MTQTTRFGGIERLYGTQGMATLKSSHVMIIGIGGVGSWSAEALVRSGVGVITLVDLDDICISNTNRQIHTTCDTIGQAKVDAMRARLTAINPDLTCHVIEDFATQDNVSTLINSNIDAVIEATDSVKAKAAIIAHCKRRKVKIVTVGGAGGQIDPTKITKGDLAKTIQDPLAAKLRSELRRNWGFSKNPKRRFGVECIYSTEQLRYPQSDGSVCFSKSEMQAGSKLDCSAGFGAVTTVTATFGMMAAASIINNITQNN